MLIVMSWFISAICVVLLQRLGWSSGNDFERESSMRWDSGSKPVKIEGELTQKLEESSTEKAKWSREKESETKEVTTSK